MKKIFYLLFVLPQIIYAAQNYKVDSNTTTQKTTFTMVDKLQVGTSTSPANINVVIYGSGTVNALTIGNSNTKYYGDGTDLLGLTGITDHNLLTSTGTKNHIQIENDINLLKNSTNQIQTDLATEVSDRILENLKIYISTGYNYNQIQSTYSYLQNEIYKIAVTTSNSNINQISLSTGVVGGLDAGKIISKIDLSTGTIGILNYQPALSTGTSGGISSGRIIDKIDLSTGTKGGLNYLIHLDSGTTGSISSGRLNDKVDLSTGTKGILSYQIHLATGTTGALSTGRLIDKISPSSGIASGIMPNNIVASSVAAQVVEIPNIRATGTPDSSVFLRGDGTWTAPAGSGDVTTNTNQTITAQKTFTAPILFTGSITFTNVNSSYTTNGDISGFNGKWQNAYASNTYINTINICPNCTDGKIKISSAVSLQNNNLFDVGLITISTTNPVNPTALINIEGGLLQYGNSRNSLFRFTNLGNTYNKIFDFSNALLGGTSYFYYINSTNYLDASGVSKVNYEYHGNTYIDSNGIVMSNPNFSFRNTLSTTTYSVKNNHIFKTESSVEPVMLINQSSYVFIKGLQLCSGSGINSITIATSTVFTEPVTVISSVTAYKLDASTIGNVSTKFYGDGSSLTGITGSGANDELCRQSTGYIRADLTTEINNRFTEDYKIGVSTGLIQSDLSTEVSNRILQDNLIGSTTQQNAINIGNETTNRINQDNLIGSTTQQNATNISNEITNRVNQDNLIGNTTNQIQYDSLQRDYQIGRDTGSINVGDVTTNTNQTISGQKTFTAPIKFTSSVTFENVNSSFTTTGDISGLNGRFDKIYSSNSYICTMNKCPNSSYFGIKSSTDIYMDRNAILDADQISIGSPTVSSNSLLNIDGRGTSLTGATAGNSAIRFTNVSSVVNRLVDFSNYGTGQMYFLYYNSQNYWRSDEIKFQQFYVGDYLDMSATRIENYTNNTLSLSGKALYIQASSSNGIRIGLTSMPSNQYPFMIDASSYVAVHGLKLSPGANFNSIVIATSTVFNDPITALSSMTIVKSLNINEDVYISSRPSAYLGWDLNGSSVTEISAGIYTVLGGTSALVTSQTVGFKVVADAKGNLNRLTYIGANPHRFTGALGGCINSATATLPTIQIRLNGNEVPYAKTSPNITVITSDVTISIPFKCSLSNGDYLEVFATTDDGDDISIDHMQLVVDASD